MGEKPRHHRVGDVCRSRTPIVRLEDEDRSRICRIAQVVPPKHWRDEHIPEYEVELVALPVTAHRSHTELEPLG